MDIDVFFKHGDLSFGFDGGNGGFKNFVGTGQNTATKPDDYKFAPVAEYDFKDDKGYAQMAGAGIGDGESYSNLTGRQAEPMNWYVNKLTDAEKTDCTKLQSTLDAITNAITENNKKSAMAKAGERRVLADYNLGLTAAGNKIKELMGAAQCDVKAQQAFNDTIAQLSKPSDTSKYILYGGLAIAVLGIVSLIIKKKK